MIHECGSSSITLSDKTSGRSQSMYSRCTSVTARSADAALSTSA
ncbi:Uncharacterised protein [Mycobacteroides abscessus subsp. abscessus]|nr:Uncharacterised protein [Mycobacteroides abscessus subsp. abscessus]SKU14932.1 Uncharacterised protein [Mycobacteroides abscessus subsp. abscessus]